MVEAGIGYVLLEVDVSPLTSVILGLHQIHQSPFAMDKTVTVYICHAPPQKLCSSLLVCVFIT